MITVERPDPAWLVAIQHRRAVLWLGPGTGEVLTGERDSMLRELLLHPWAAIVLDGPGLSLRDFVTENESWGSLVLRLYEDDPGPARLPPNRLPIYAIRGSRGRTRAGDAHDPTAFMNRVTMLKRIPLQHEVVVVGLGGDEGIAGLVEAQAVSAAFGRLILVGTAVEDVARLELAADSLYHWRAGVDTLVEFLRDTEPADSSLQIVVRTSAGVRVVDLSGAIDASYPITTSFELVPAAASLARPAPTVELLRSFLSDPTQSWTPFAAGIPAERTTEYEKALTRLVEQFDGEGANASVTAWLPVEQGSGATTILRQLALALAQRGIPVLVARPGIARFDHIQLSAFLTKASDRFAGEGALAAELPWVIVFDSEHTLLHGDFVTAIGGALRKLLRPVVIVAARPVANGPSDARFVAQGANRVLGPPLSNSVTAEEALVIGRHLSGLLPADMRRSDEEWIAFASDTVRTSFEARSSLFWVALRFWLFRLPGAGETLGGWLASKFETAAGSDRALRSGLLEIAVMSRYRLAMPSQWLQSQAYQPVRLLAFDTGNPLGLRRVNHESVDAFAFAHPLIAEELLRIASSNATSLAAIDMPTCLSLLDLELHLLERIVSNPAAGASETIDVIEDLVTTGLRVDPREAPRNYFARDRIVALLEQAPDSVWDASQVFNHHLAKARRHLAVDPPGEEWSITARLEQLELAENHLLDALQNISPEETDRRESPLNLQVSLALTYVARERLEAEAGDTVRAREYRRRAESSYRSAQRLDPDNSYVLENFARFKIFGARNAETDDDQIRLLVEGIALLQWERAMLERGARDEPILLELAKAHEMLKADAGFDLLARLSQQGSESAAVALAQLALWESDDLRRASALSEAEQILTRIERPVATWRSQFTLYRVITELRPWDFPVRLELLRTLDADPEFPWPLQLQLEYGILLFQAGDQADRLRGKEVFQIVRDQMSERSGTLSVPPELRFLADPAKDFRQRLLTSMVVKDVSSVGRNFYAVPNGWYNIVIPFRPYLFGENIRQGDERDCFIQFTNFGPQAVPPTTQ